ncbi:MAG TPA: PASTA domain-containing protein [Terriglobales bacterium]|nr:PASTA domain-containing protein [Terriglobales bacterium]
MIRFLRFLMRSLVLLLIALASALLTMRWAIHGREVRVPNMVGLTTVQASETANRSGLIASVDDKFYSPDVPAGKVLSQIPAAGAPVRRGWRVRVAESLGPQRVPIPDVVGESEYAATLNLRRRGLDVASIARVEIPGATAGQVIAQSPPANAVGTISPNVNLLVAAAPAPPEYVMPDLVGDSLADAKQRIVQAGLKAPEVSSASLPNGTGDVETPTAAPTAGTVTRQNPPPGSRVTSDTVLELEVR